MPWLGLLIGLLIGLLAFAAGWVACMAVDAWADDHRRGYLDFTAVADRVDWDFPPAPGGDR